MFAASKTSASGVAPDPQFNYVTMLLHGDGTNGAQNNTFIDSSANNYTITRNGNTTQGSFSPYGSNWSNYFLSSANSYLTTTMTGQTFGTGDFTIEFWINPLSTALSDIIDTRSAGDSINAYSVQFDGTSLVFANTSNYLSVPVAQFPIGAWTHVAYTRASGTMKVYVNGTQYGSSVSLTSDFTNTRMDIGVAVRTYYYSGYISNLRLVRGTAVYTSNFTPSTTPLTAISGTALLTCQSNRFIDNSSNAFAITVTGTPSIQRFNPFGTATAYSTSVIGGSGYFDSDDRLNLPAQSSMTGDFTVELYFYITGKGLGDPTFISNWPVAGTAGNIFVIQMVGTSTTVFAVYAGSATGSGNLAFTASNSVYNQWNHIAVTRSGSSMACFLNGVRVATSTNSNTITLPANTAIGSYSNGDSGGNYFKGYISNLRIVNGTAVYNPSLTTCTVPTTPVTAITNTQLLTNFTNGAIFDNAMMNDLETVGNAQISTSVVKYGTGSLAFDGTGDYLLSNPATTELYAFGTGDFTIEFWLYLNSTSSVQVFYDSRPASAQGLQPTIYINSSGTLFYYTNVANRITGSSLSTNTWYHIAVARSGTSTKMFVNGTQVGSTYTDSTNYVNPASRPIIGADGFNSGTPGGNATNGYIDDLRVTKGYARYAANFTAPTAAFPNTGPV